MSVTNYFIAHSVYAPDAAVGRVSRLAASKRERYPPEKYVPSSLTDVAARLPRVFRQVRPDFGLKLRAKRPVSSLRRLNPSLATYNEPFPPHARAPSFRFPRGILSFPSSSIFFLSVSLSLPLSFAVSPLRFYTSITVASTWFTWPGDARYSRRENAQRRISETRRRRRRNNGAEERDIA